MVAVFITTQGWIGLALIIAGVLGLVYAVSELRRR